ncbi:MAG: hypothetical protein GXY49_12670 [Syntrophomonadaceae bacterium]|nr:hypothetical protein [Syntrophomonadaceae bacterium]
MKNNICKILIFLFISLNLSGCAWIEEDKTNKVGKSEMQSINLPYSIRENISFAINSDMIERMYGKPQVIRKLQERTYEIRDMDDGSKLFVIYENKSSHVTDIWRLKTLLSHQSLKNIDVGKTTLNDIKNVDPYTAIFETSKNHGISEHRLKDNEALIINYKRSGSTWVVVDYRYIKPDPSGFSTIIIPADLSQIS